MKKINYRLGLDIGIASVGWAVINLDLNRIEKMGVRCFETAEQPKTGESTAVPRRGFRGNRRRLRRRSHRLERIKRLFLKENIITKDICDIYLSKTPKLSENEKSPWELRAEGLERQLTHIELFRALYHLAKKRGFKSNKKSETVSGDGGKLLNGVSSTEKLMELKKYKSIAEMVIKDEEFTKKIKNTNGDYKHTFLRSSLENEAKLIIDKQIEFGLKLSENFKESFIKIFNNQRNFDDGPNGPDSDYGLGASSPYYHPDGQIAKMVGDCTFEKGEQRATKACFTSEKFIALEKLSKIRLEYEKESIPLSQEEINLVLETLKNKDKMKFKDLRKLLNIDEKFKFNLVDYSKETNKAEETEALKFESYHKMKKCFDKVDKNLWFNISENIIDEIAKIIRLSKSDDKTREKLKELNINNEVIEELLHLNFTKNHNLSLKALKKLIPYMEQGLTYDKACENAGYDFRNLSQTKTKSGKPELFLPEIDRNEVINPVVIRSLSQTRKVINEIIRIYGSPVSIHVETARELSKSFDERRKIKKSNDETKDKKDKMAILFKGELEREPKEDSDELFKFMLYKEQGGKCMYSLEGLDLNRVINDGTYSQVDHILPYSRTLDNSQSNRVLVLTRENQKKLNRTPYEYFGQDKNKWETFEVFVKGLNISLKKKQNLLREKLSSEATKDFRDRNLNDTRYINRYLGNFIERNLVFENYENEKKKVYRVSGAITSFLRNKWGLTEKNREENDLHHSIDALIVACTTQGMIQSVQNYSKRKVFYNVKVDDTYIDPETGEILESKYKVHTKDKFPLPWENFRDEVELRVNAENPKEALLNDIQLLRTFPYDENFVENIKPIFISRMPNRKGKGSGHDATIRSRKLLDKGQRLTYKKEAIEKITIKDIETTKDTYLYDSDKKTYDLLLEKLKEKELTKSKESILPFAKPSKTGNGQIVTKLKIASSDGISGITINNGIAANGDMVRIDLFKKEGKHYIIPVYAHQIEKGILPNKAINGTNEESWIEMDETYVFVYSIYPNDYIKLINKKGVLEGYYSSADRSTNSLKIFNHSSKNIFTRGIGIRSMEEIKKYEVTILGDKFEVKGEKRKI